MTTLLLKELHINIELIAENEILELVNPLMVKHERLENIGEIFLMLKHNEKNSRKCREIVDLLSAAGFVYYISNGLIHMISTKYLAVDSDSEEIAFNVAMRSRIIQTLIYAGVIRQYEPKLPDDISKYIDRANAILTEMVDTVRWGDYMITLVPRPPERVSSSGFPQFTPPRDMILDENAKEIIFNEDIKYIPNGRSSINIPPIIDTQSDSKVISYRDISDFESDTEESSPSSDESDTEEDFVPFPEIFNFDESRLPDLDTSIINPMNRLVTYDALCLIDTIIFRTVNNINDRSLVPSATKTSVFFIKQPEIVGFSFLGHLLYTLTTHLVSVCKSYKEMRAISTTLFNKYYCKYKSRYKLSGDELRRDVFKDIKEKIASDSILESIFLTLRALCVQSLKYIVSPYPVFKNKRVRNKETNEIVILYTLVPTLIVDEDNAEVNHIGFGTILSSEDDEILEVNPQRIFTNDGRKIIA
jgi:hypothetical protein